MDMTTKVDVGTDEGLGIGWFSSRGCVHHHESHAFGLYLRFCPLYFLLLSPSVLIVGSSFLSQLISTYYSLATAALGGF